MADRKEEKDEMYETHPYGIQSVRETVETAKKYRDKEVLIAGCGAGKRVFELDFYGANVTAVDQSESAIEFIRTQFEELGCDPPELYVSDLASISLPAGKFDYIVCSGVLHHTVDPDTILRNFREWLAPQGTLELLLYHTVSPVRMEREFISELNDRCKVGSVLPEEFKRRIEWWDKYENPLWKTYTREEARALVEGAGFTVDDLWLSNTPFGQFTSWLLPPVLRLPLERLLRDCRWHIRIDAVT